MWSSGSSLPRPSLAHHRSVATSRMFPTASFTSIIGAQGCHPHGFCWRHAESWTRMAWWRSFPTTLAVLKLVFAQKSKWQFSSWVVAQLQPPPHHLVSPLHSPHCAGRHSRPFGQRARRSCTTWVASVGCRYHFALPLVANEKCKTRISQKGWGEELFRAHRL